MKIGRMTWAGFGVALIGWVLLVAALAIGDTLLRAGSLVAELSWRGDAVTLAQSLIVTGFGLAVVGILQAGFGALTRFFDAVLQRAVAPRPRGPMPLEPLTAEPLAPEPFTPEPFAPEPAIDRDAEPEIGSAAAAVPDPVVASRRPFPRSPAFKVAADRPGRGADRNYVILADGSVEVETMFGTRVFASLDEARDFIR